MTSIKVSIHAHTLSYPLHLRITPFKCGAVHAEHGANFSLVARTSKLVSITVRPLSFKKHNRNIAPKHGAGVVGEHVLEVRLGEMGWMDQGLKQPLCPR